VTAKKTETFFEKLSDLLKRILDKDNLSTLRSNKFRDSTERSVGEDQFSGACEGKLTLDFDTASVNPLNSPTFRSDETLTFSTTCKG
jgi:hypothetical protein